ncbi:hypothetical protein L7F22_036300 [Adiantum nelumboides]|nr:hypothetical protein [Adiantum nelumboides]
MDWSSVTLHELADAVKEADWWSSPRPLSEVFTKFSPPKSFSAWSSRLKCNLYVYRINYYILLVSFLLLFAGALRSPIAALGAVLTTFATACINDSFAMFVNEKVLRCARRIYPPLAAKMRAPLTSGGRARPSKGTIHICGKERSHVVAVLLSVSVLSWFLSAQIRILGLTICLVMTVVLVHASFRIPNLKARLNTFREEFRAVWRSYSDI